MCCSSGMFMCSVSRYRVTRVAHKSGSCLGKTSRHRSAWTAAVKFWTPWFVTWGLIRFVWSRVWSFVSKDWRNVRCVCGVVRTTWIFGIQPVKSLHGIRIGVCNGVCILLHVIAIFIKLYSLNKGCSCHKDEKVSHCCCLVVFVLNVYKRNNWKFNLY